MKKTYLKPERTITVTSFNGLVLLAGSAKGSIKFNDDDTGTGSIEVQNANAGGAAMSRSSSVWDDEF